MRRQAESHILTTNGFPKKLSTDAGGGAAAIIFVTSRKSYIRLLRMRAWVRVRRMAV